MNTRLLKKLSTPPRSRHRLDDLDEAIRLVGPPPKYLVANSTAPISFVAHGARLRALPDLDRVHLSYHWLSEDGGAVLCWNGNRSEPLKRAAETEGPVEIELALTAPSEAGECRLCLDLVEENVQWFGLDKRLAVTVFPESLAWRRLMDLPSDFLEPLVEWANIIEFGDADLHDEHDSLHALHTGIGACIEQFTELPKTARCLEVGTGTGRCRLGLLDCGYRDVWGCDISQPALVKQRYWEKELGKPSNGRLVCCKADSLGFVADSFDCVISVSTLHHIPNISKFLREAARVLREGGYLVILEEPSENALETFDERFDRNARIDLKMVFESFIHRHLVRSESSTRFAELYDGVGFSRDFLTRHLENASFEVRRIYQASFFTRLWSQVLQPLARKGDLADEAGRLCTKADVLLGQILKEDDIGRLFFDTNAIAVKRSKSRGRTHGDAEGSAVSADEPLCRSAG